ncbi:hypothetical protein, unlikely [Trypanosoma congolense IL3000]|uniref:Uncharacterized protein n=1 Tax=Trypanosoma congolense (strain IL3000) TaxID=1068625 RepID=F9WJI8_TRYCI|nr:hypothetical protein, unlikely [Trypanosoma congolense IL3000]
MFHYLLFPYFLSFLVWLLRESSENNQWSGRRLTYSHAATATRIAAWRVVSKLFERCIVSLLFMLLYLFRYLLLLFFPSLFHRAYVMRVVAMARHAFTFYGLFFLWRLELILACNAVTFTRYFVCILTLWVCVGIFFLF